jgi:uracil phosphoribosyltransferase
MLPPTFHVSSHPAVLHKLAILRDEKTEPKKFREIVRELSWLLGYEALADARVRTRQVTTPLETMEGHELGERIGLIPILRAGLGMVEAVTELFPEVAVGYIGLERDHATFQPSAYYTKLPPLHDSYVLLLDPMLATGGSASAACNSLFAERPAKVTLLSVVAAPEGIERLRREQPQLDIVTAAVDERLNDSAYIVPGLGDFGDRLYGT